MESVLLHLLQNQYSQHQIVLLQLWSQFHILIFLHHHVHQHHLGGTIQYLIHHHQQQYNKIHQDQVFLDHHLFDMVVDLMNLKVQNLDFGMLMESENQHPQYHHHYHFHQHHRHLLHHLIHTDLL